MFPEQLKKILNLAKKTGDRVIIYDGNAPDDSYVIMDTGRYLDLIGEQKSTKILTNIKDEETVDSAKIKEESVQSENLTGEDLTDKINREILMWKNRDDSGFSEEESRPKKAWQIPPQVKNNAREVN